MLSNDSNNNYNKPRLGSKDIWNARLLEGATYTEGSDMPICFRCNGTIPNGVDGYDDALSLDKKLVRKDPNYHVDSYIHTYMDDQKFDGNRSGIWYYPEKFIKLARHYSGVISPDFSTYADFPDSQKRWNIYRMRAFDYILQKSGIRVIPNVRWGTSETWEYCFDGIPINGIFAIGVVASGINKVSNRKCFIDGLYRAIEVLKPHTIIVYGSDNYDVFDRIREQGIKVIAFPSKTNLAFMKEGNK
ncbi:MAG: DUF4417 domain-containing protein [Saccharofermentans sp.]|nr:DUF4417 domain-containing protein [Saccharofermentans sp.]